jgi:hypothetical protein
MGWWGDGRGTMGGAEREKARGVRLAPYPGSVTVSSQYGPWGRMVR